jgi:hypothetical protein
MISLLRRYSIGRAGDLLAFSFDHLARATRAQEPLLPANLPVPPADDGHESCACDHAGPGPACNEEAFRYFLAIERKRAARSGRPLLLLFVNVKGGTARIGEAVSSRLLAAMAQCLRETDVVGWYREGRIAGAVLMQGADTQGAVTSHQVRERVERALVRRLRRVDSASLLVRVFRLPATKGAR